MNQTLRIISLFSVLALLMIIFGAIIGYLVGDFYLFMSIFFVIAIIMNIVSYFESDKMALKMTGSRLISKSENPRFYNIVERVSKEAGIKTPKIGIMDTDIPNAFATGRNENNSVVVATRGILNMLNDDELEAVIGHEISHIKHKDILVSTVAATIATIISYLGNMILFSMFFGGPEDNRNGNANILLLIAAILIPIGAMFVQLGISRSREAYADEGSVRITKKPDDLISSLKKISVKPTVRNVQRTSNPNAYSSLFIVNNISAHSLMDLFSTHPSLEKRIENIQRVRKELHI